MRSSFMLALPALVLFAACDNSRTLDTSQAPPPPAQVIVTDAAPPPRPLDAGAVDALLGCGAPFMDGSMSHPYLTLGCPFDEASCPVDRSMVIEGYGGYPLDSPVGDCRIGVGALLSSARLVLQQRSRVTVKVRTSQPASYVTSFRIQCFVDSARCAQDEPNVQVLEAGEYTLEVVLSRETAFSLDVQIAPL